MSFGIIIHLGSALIETIIYKPVGIVMNSFNQASEPEMIRRSESILLLNESYVPALEGIEHFKYLIILYHIDRSPGYTPLVHPHGDPNIPKRGVFSTRSPCRPNPIGITVVEVLQVRGNRIRVKCLDALNGTPILDIKPYEKHFDSPPE